MPATFLFPSITHLPPGYDCTIAVPYQRVADRLIGGRGTVAYTIQVFCEGAMQAEQGGQLVFERGRLAGPAPDAFTWRDAGDKWDGNSGYLELSFQAGDGQAIFHTQAVIGFYSIYTKQGRKAFFSDNAYKYGSPPIIGQIAAFGRFVDGYPVVHLDRARDLGLSLVLINPYKKPVNARVFAHDGRTCPFVKVPPVSVRVLRLAELLRQDEPSWIGQIQLTANNRLVTYVMMHSLRDPRIISDHEHLDPFRSDPTHLPAFQLLRQRVGKYLMYRGFIRGGA